MSRLRQVFADRAVETAPERRVPARDASPAAYPDADAFVRFEEADPKLGRGLIVEVQYKNHGKPVRETTRDYLAASYSVAWVTPDDFTAEQCLLTEPVLRARARDAVWPRHVPPAASWPSPHDYLDSDVDMEIPAHTLVSRGELFEWWCRGLEDHPAFRDAVPPPRAWTGTHELENLYTAPELDVVFPSELLAAHREDLERVHAVHADGEFDSFRELSEANATRRCQECQDTAAVHVRGAVDTNGFYC